MADIKSIFQTLVNNLSGLNVQLKIMAETLKKVENNEMDALKESYDLKYSIINEIKSLGSEFNSMQDSLSNILDKMHVSHEGVDKQFREINESIKKIPAGSGNCDNCEALKAKDQVIKEKERWNKRLWGVAIGLVILLLTLLGLNVTGILRLPGIGG